MRKFSVGVYSREAKKCQNAWIEINESDQVAAAAEDHSASPPTKQSSKAASAPKPPTTLSRRYSSSSTTDSSLNNANRTGDKFCGTLHNFWTSFYSAKRTVTLEFVSSKLLSVWNSNQSNQLRLRCVYIKKMKKKSFLQLFFFFSWERKCTVIKSFYTFSFLFRSIA